MSDVVKTDLPKGAADGEPAAGGMVINRRAACSHVD